uniref:Large ribosomal subunit protein uL22c n=2 Tax=Didiereaceae TaxID=3584 RepID=A0A411K1S7_ALLPR|nr:ribosomal protein L22 [Alluaudia procera]
MGILIKNIKQQVKNITQQEDENFVYPSYKIIKNRRQNENPELYYLTQVKESERVYALGQYIPMSAHKAQRVIDQIRGRFYEEALMILELMPYRACYPIFKLIYSAGANASHNKSLNTGTLFISKAEVHKGTNMKKLKPRARGRSYLIKRPTCHITIVLADVAYLNAFRESIRTFSKSQRQEIVSLANSPTQYSEFVCKRIVKGDIKVD